jgi:hypothetical protein
MTMKLTKSGSQTIDSSACLLVGSPARRLIGSSVHKEVSLDYYIFSGMRETLEFFSHLFFLLIERLVQRRLIGSSIPLQFFLTVPFLN